MKILLTLLLFFPLSLSAQQWGTLSVDAVETMNTSTPGTAMTAAIAQAGLVCGANCSSSTLTWGAPATGFTVGANQNACSNLGPVQLTGTGGTLYAAQSLNYNNFAHADADNNNNQVLTFSGTPGSKTLVQALECITLGPPYQGSSGDDWDMSIFFSSNSNGNFETLQFNSKCGSSSSYGMRIEVKPTAHAPCINLAPQGTYWFAMTYDLTLGAAGVCVWTAGGTPVGCTAIVAGDIGGSVATFFYGNNENGNNSGTTTYWQDQMWCFTCTLPTGTGATLTGSTSTGTVTGLTGASSAWYGDPLFLGSAGSALPYLINSCSSSSTCAVTCVPPNGSTTCTVTAVSGVSWEVQTPLFWTNNSLAAGVLPPERFTNWNPGVPGGIPSGSWTQCATSACNTVAAGPASSITSTQINSAISSASANTYVFLPAGTYSSATGCIKVSTSNVELRGAGANQTYLAPTSSSGCGSGVGAAGSILIGSTGNFAGSPQNGPVAVTGSTVQGSTTLTLASVPNLVVGNPIVLDQLDPTCDNGGIFVNGTGSSYTCTATSPGGGGPYNSDGGGNGIRGGSGCSSSPSGCYHQQQIVKVTQCDGNTTVGHACSSGANITISPGLHMPNWSPANMFAWWATSPILNAGIRDVHLNNSGNSDAAGVQVENCQGCWVKGIASTYAGEAGVELSYSNLDSIVNNYFFLTQNAAPVSYGVESFSSSDVLTENNIFQAITTPMICNGPCSGSVNGYNFAINDYYTSTANYSIPAIGGHAGGTDALLSEGNILDGTTEDTIHGTANLNAYFRNAMSVQPACYASGSSYSATTYGACNSGITVMQVYAFHRFTSLIANTVGTQSTISTYCNGNNASTGCGTSYTANNTNAFGIGYGNGSVGTDTNTLSTIMLWGNSDPVTGFSSPRFNCSEVPQFPALATATSSVYLVQFPYLAECPATDTLPASFYYASKPSWWPSGKAWPIIGPDVSTGNVLATSGYSHGSALVTNASQCSGCSTSSYANSEVTSNPAMDCALGTMGISPDGTSAEASFNEITCYGGAATTTGSQVPSGSEFKGSQISVLKELKLDRLGNSSSSAR